MIDIYVSIRVLEKSCRYLRHWLHIKNIRTHKVRFFVKFEIPLSKKNQIYLTLILMEKSIQVKFFIQKLR